MRRPSDHAVVTAAAHGDARSWEELVDRHAPAMRACAATLTTSEAAQETACQLAWLRLAQRLDQPPRSVRAWLLEQVEKETARQDPMSQRSAAS